MIEQAQRQAEGNQGQCILPKVQRLGGLQATCQWLLILSENVQGYWGAMWDPKLCAATPTWYLQLDGNRLRSSGRSCAPSS